MEPELAAKFPEIKTFRGEGIDDPAASIRFDITPAGFHAQILSPNGAVYVDPAFRGENGLHTSYFKRDYVRRDNFQCFMPENVATAGRETSGRGGSSGMQTFDLARSGGNLRTYRAAVAATAEYTAFHGGTVALGQAAIVTSMNRVVGVYEIELAIRMVLVANNDLLVYTNSATDPYSNGNPSSLLTQNQNNIDAIIGNGNYDIGHVFSTAGGGLAGLGVVCDTGVKARGETGTDFPMGDAFNIDYVAHEMGHQFGANHTFNSTTSSCGGNRNASTAYERGSGSTIMAYAGICETDDLQLHSDPYFHSASFDEIIAFTTSGDGNSCAVITSTGNTAPTVSAGPNYTIPQNTPFTLTASGSDPNGDSLTYCWEERDLGAATTVAAADNGSSPLFRSFNPVSSPSRTFPRLPNLLNNTLNVGEVMPTTTRTMNFRVTARDNRAGGGGVNTSDMQVNVTTAAGPFLVTSHNSGGTFSGLQTVTWNVAGTTNAPVNASTVNILLSTNGGLTYPFTLATATPNDGSQLVVFPNVITTTARVKVEAAANIFFDICNTNFSIIFSVPTPLVLLDSAALAVESCITTNNAIDPNETVTVNFALRNTGSGDTTNLVATLLLTNGVVSASSPQNYGVVPAGGVSVTNSFSLVATGGCGGSFTAVLQLQDGASNLGTVARTFNLGAMLGGPTHRTNATTIEIPGSSTKGPGAPFPSLVNVSGVTGTVSKVTVSLMGFGHSWPADVDVLLVGPTGQTLLLMSDTGGGESVSGITFTFDDNAAGPLSGTEAMSSGDYRPSNYGSVDTFSAPAPGGSYGATLSVFNGLNPNGTWSLYVEDDSNQDTGSIVQGWRLTVTTSDSSCCIPPIQLADLVVGQTVSPSLVNVGSNASFTINVTNLGPDTANSVMITNALPAGLTFVSAVASQGSCTNNSGVVTCNLGPLTNGGVASVTMQVTAVGAGVKTNQASTTSSTPDPVSTNNTAARILTVNAFPVISDIPNVVTNEDSVVGLAFTIGDLETAAGALNLGVSSSDTNLVPLANISFGGANSNRTITVTPVGNLSGSSTITVTVTDGLATNSDAFLLTVNAVNDVPTLAPITNFTLVEGETLTFTNAASDIETATPLLVFSLANGPTNANVNPTNGVFAWTTGESDGPTTNVISVAVTDSGVPSMSATQSFTVIVLETNLAPVLSTISNQVVFEGTLLTFTNVASDPDLPANLLAFALENAPAGAGINPTNGVFAWTPSEAQGPGTNTMSVIVSDNGLPGLSATQSFTVVVMETNQAPVLTPISDVVIVEGASVTNTNLASDSDTPPNELTFILASAPGGAAINPTNGVFTWVTSEANGPSSNHVSVVVTDNGSPALSATQSFTVVVLETNAAPNLAAITNFTLVEGETLTFTNAAGDLDLPANVLTFSLQDAPTNAVVNPTNGVFSWTPNETQGPSSNHIVVIVSDNGTPSLSATQSFSVLVFETNNAPVFAVIGDYVIIEGTTLTITNVATDSDTPTNELTFSLGIAPTNAVINPTNGVFTWTPTEAQGPSSNAIHVIVTDNGAPSLSATQSFTVFVLETNAAPVLAAIADHKIHVGRTLVITNNSTDSDVPPSSLTFSLDAAPATAVIDTNTSVFSWTPSDEDADIVHSITVRVTDGGSPPQFDTKTFLVTVVSRPLITSMEISNSVVVVTWVSLVGENYRLQHSTNLGSNWVDVLPTVTAGGPSASQTDAYDPTSQRFYRVRLVP